MRWLRLNHKADWTDATLQVKRARKGAQKLGIKKPRRNRKTRDYVTTVKDVIAIIETKK